MVLWPRLPTTIRSASVMRARSRMATAGRPERTAVSTRRAGLARCVLAAWTKSRECRWNSASTCIAFRVASEVQVRADRAHGPAATGATGWTTVTMSIVVSAGQSTPLTRASDSADASEPSTATRTRIGISGFSIGPPRQHSPRRYLERVSSPACATTSGFRTAQPGRSARCTQGWQNPRVVSSPRILFRPAP